MLFKIILFIYYYFGCKDNTFFLYIDKDDKKLQEYVT